MIRILTLIATLGLFSFVQAAPIPGSTTSPLISAKKGQFYSDIGFTLNSAKTEWMLTPPPSESKYMVTMYRSPEAYKSVHASLTVRLDRLGKKKELKEYVKKWLRRYPRFGFDVLGAKTFRNKGSRGYVIDLVNRENERQLRQVIFMKQSSAIVLTCRDHVDNFDNSLKNCNQIIRTFEWTQNEELPQETQDLIEPAADAGNPS